MKNISLCLVLFAILSLLLNCASSITHKVGYPSPDELFVTLGDDPGSESATPYSPRGQLIHVEKEAYLPIPILGIFMKSGNASPQFVFDAKIIPEVEQMGGDALIGAHVSYTPQGPWILGLLGMRHGAMTVITGQVVNRQGAQAESVQQTDAFEPEPADSDTEAVWADSQDQQRVEDLFYEILKIKQGYFLVKADRPEYFSKGKLCEIVRGSKSDYASIGEGRVIQTLDNNIAFKIVDGSPQVGDLVHTCSKYRLSGGSASYLRASLKRHL
ncbi:MAG: hypothetical protein U5R06_23860 [candidate division KSB1 bacterium]|nr:hypothetical protein [candidate division KSB1 bacterium]